MFSPLLLTAAMAFQTPAASAGPACRVAAFDAMAFYTGSWRVTMEARLSKQGPWETTAATSTIVPELAGCALVERLDTTRQGKPLQLLSILTFDQNGSKWQLTVTDSEHGRMQTYEGRDAGTSLVLLVNLEIPGGKVLLRRTLAREGADAFQWESARSTDEGKTWDTTSRMNYRRAGATPAAGGERIGIPAAGGAVLRARYRDAGRGAPAVLFFPMCRADALDGWAPVAERLETAGVSSLTLSYRGYGESTGEMMPRMPLDASKAYWRDRWGPDADAAIAYLRTRIGADAPIALAGSSCGVYMALLTASRHPERTRAVVALSGPHGDDQVEYLRRTPGLALFTGASTGDGPTAQWAQALKDASANAGSATRILPGRVHGTDMLTSAPLAADIAEWLARQLEAGGR